MTAEGVRKLAWLACTLAALPRTPDTEIDWIAYMQEVRGFLQGERDYLQMRGDTGPLVYPAVFVYVYAWLHELTGGGEDIRLAQWLFGGVYLATTALVLFIYAKARVTPPWVAIFLVASRRVHSIFVLRLFNDGLAMLLLYAAIALYISRAKLAGCFIFSLAVGMKMNILLFAPGLLVLMLRGSGVVGTAVELAVCAGVQLVTGAPFLLTYPVSYLTKAFELSRVFTYKWTVNWRFLPEEVFVSKPLALALLAGHLLCLGLLLWRWGRHRPVSVQGGSGRQAREVKSSGGAAGSLQLAAGAAEHRDAAGYQVLVLFMSNFIGVAFARTLHYQFYSWYWHALPMLAFLVLGGVGVWRHQTAVAASTWSRHGVLCLGMLLLIGCIELAFNVFPATWWSSALLQAAHAVLLLGLFSLRPEDFDQSVDAKKAN